MAKRTASRAGRRKTGGSDLGSDIHALLDRTANDRETLTAALEQAQHAQDALLKAQDRLATLEHEQSVEFARMESELTSERDEAVDQARALKAEHAQTTKDLKAALKTLRGVCGALIKTPDPLDPLGPDDNDRDLRDLRDHLDDLVDRRGSTPTDLPGMDSALEAARDLVDVLAARVKVQSNRVKLLQNHLADIEQDNETLRTEAEALRAANDGAEAAIDQTLEDMEQVSHQIALLQEELEASERRNEEQAADSAEMEERHAAKVADLAEQITAGQARAKDLEQALRGAKDLAHKAEHAGAELAEVVVGLCDAEIGQGEVCPMPSLSARDELAALANDAGEDWDDEVDELFSQDLGEDMVAATKTVCDALLKRRQAVVDALQAERARAEELEGRCADQADELGELRSTLNETEQELSRTQAQLETTTEELEQTSAELATKHRELTEKSGALAQTLSELEAVREQADEAKTLKAQLSTTEKNLGDFAKRMKAADTLRSEASRSQNQLAKALVELATATDAALAAGNLKSNGHVSRFTKSFKKLDDVVQHSDGDLLRLIRSSADVVDKVTNRVEHIAVELRDRGANINENNRHLRQLEQAHEKATKTLQGQEDALKELKDQHAELARTAKHAAKLEDQLATKEAALEEATEALKELKDQHRMATAELEELRAREEELSESSEREVAELKRRLAEENSNRRSTESELADERESLTAQITTLEARYAELENGLDDREQQIASLQAELDDAADLKALLKEAQSHVKQLSKDLDAERSRSRQLQDELADQAEADSLAEELKEMSAERDDLQKRLRQAEKRLADDAGTIASLKTTNESLGRKLDDRTGKYREELEALQERCDGLMEENRRMKEKNAGLNARVRSLTNY